MCLTCTLAHASCEVYPHGTNIARTGAYITFNLWHIHGEGHCLTEIDPFIVIEDSVRIWGSRMYAKQCLVRVVSSGRSFAITTVVQHQTRGLFQSVWTYIGNWLFHIVITHIEHQMLEQTVLLLCNIVAYIKKLVLKLCRHIDMCIHHVEYMFDCYMTNCITPVIRMRCVKYITSVEHVYMLHMHYSCIYTQVMHVYIIHHVWTCVLHVFYNVIQV